MGTPIQPCSLDMVREYLKNNLTVRVLRDFDWETPYIKVEILLDGDVVTSDFTMIPD